VQGEGGVRGVQKERAVALPVLRGGGTGQGRVAARRSHQALLPALLHVVLPTTSVIPSVASFTPRREGWGRSGGPVPLRGPAGALLGDLLRGGLRGQRTALLAE